MSKLIIEIIVLKTINQSLSELVVSFWLFATGKPCNFINSNYCYNQMLSHLYENTLYYYLIGNPLVF